MSQASLQSFQELLKDEKRTSQAKEILLYVKSKCEETPGLGADLKLLWLHFPKIRQSAISARVAELHATGYIRFISHPLFNQSILKYVSDENERETIRKAVQEEKRLKWEKLGKRNGWASKPDYRNLKLNFK